MVACSEPLLLPLPRGVRMASNTNASVAAIPRAPRSRKRGAGRYHRNIQFMNASCVVVTMAATTTSSRPPAAQPGRAQRRDARGAARRDARVPGRGRLRQHDDRARGRARRRSPAARTCTTSRRATRCWPPPSSTSPGAARERAAAPRPTRCPTGPDRVARGLDLLWAQLRQPALPGGAGPLDRTRRTDAELREHLVPVERALDRQTLELARRLFPDAARRARTSSASSSWRVATDPRAGRARHAAPRRRRAPRKQWAFCRATLVELFAP